MKKRIILIIAIILLLVPAFIFLVPVKDGRTVYKNIKYKQLLAGAIQQDNYDKMKISYARIVERKTGKAPFDNVSNMEGKDSTDSNEYLRTFDKLSYTIEVGIDLNEATTQPSDNLTGGIIKVKAIVPKDENGVSYMGLSNETWMNDFKINNDGTEITAYYRIPSDKAAAGGNQQLTFILYTNAHKKELTPDLMPVFEIWMEGNKPDNDESGARSVVISDEEGLIITSKKDINLQVGIGKVNNYYEKDGVKGQLINFRVGAILESGVGIEAPLDNFETNVKIEYEYRDVTNNGPWINLENVDGVDIINNTELVASGVMCDAVPGFLPSENDNRPPPGSNGCGRSSGWLSTAGPLGDPNKYVWKHFDSGTATITLNDNIINVKNTGFYVNGNYNLNGSEILHDGIELFIPFYEPEENVEYAYKIALKASNPSFEYEDETKTFNETPMIIYNFRNKAAGNVSLYFSVYNNAYSEDTNQYIGTIFNDNGITGLVPTAYKEVVSMVNGQDGPYNGGMERIITWHSNIFELGNKDKFEFTYGNPGVMPMPSEENVVIQFGVFKENPTLGLDTDELVNNSNFNDFDWYGTVTEAREHGTPCAIRIIEEEYRGNNINSSFHFYLKSKNESDIFGKKGFVRQKAYLYEDQEKTHVFYGGTNVDYSPTVLNEEDGSVIQKGSPTGVGSTLIAVNTKLGMTLEPKKYTYNVEEEIISIKLTPTVSTFDEDIKNVTFSVEAKIPTNISFDPNSVNYQYSDIAELDDGTTLVTWEFENWDIDDLPVITFNSIISPYTPNNSSLYFYGYTLIPGIPGTASSSANIRIINLSGSSLRKVIEKEYVDKNEYINIDNYIYNIAQRVLTDVKILEILPKNGDEIGSSYNGTYTLKVLSLLDNQKIYYTTNSIDNIGIEEDSTGKKHIQNVDLDNDDRWIELQVNDIIPSDATAIASYIPEISATNDVNYKLEFIPANNQKDNKYYFKMNASSASLENAISSEYKKIQVVDRRISGIVFEDLNRNDLLNETDAKLNNYTIELLNESGTKIDETTTNTEGYYEFEVEKGNYYIRFNNLPEGYEVLPVGTSDNSNKINSTLVSNVINHTETPKNAIENITVNYGIRKKPATLVVKYLDKNDNHPLVDQIEETVYYTDNYETHGLTTIPENYSFLETAGAPVADVVNSDYIEVIYYYDFTPATITAKHYIDGTSNKIHEDVIQNKKLTQPYSTSVLDTANLNYEYVRTDGDSTSGTVDKTEIVVNYYYRLKKGTVTTHHYLYDNGDTTTKLAPDVTREWNYTDTYTTSISNEVPENYEFYKKSDNYTNIMSSPNVEVNYYYRLKDSSLTTSINTVGTEEITSKDSEVEYTITYNAEVSEYIGEATITIIDTLPYEIDVDNSILDGGTYNATNRTITWTESWTDIDTYAGRDKTTIEKNIKLTYVGIVGRDRIMTNTTTGTITLSNNSRESQAQISTNIRIKGKIKVIYIDSETNDEIFDAVEEEDLVGEEFISSAIEKDGYKLVTKPDSETFEFEEEDQLITYSYEHIKFEIKGKVLGVGGRIRGDEDVYWGDDSTEGNIIVEADEGYIIEAILVNGEKMDIEPGQVTLILSNFKEVLENKNIEVVFAKKPQENPNTKAFIGLIVLISWLILFTNAILLKKSQELE